MKFAIAGAGIGGLSTALALHADGHEVSVYEAAPELSALGVGINLLPHAAEILGRLDVVSDLLAAGVATRELSYFNCFGQHIWTEPRGLFGGFKAPQISLGRGQLQMTLLEHARKSLGEERIVTGQKLTAFRTEGDISIGSFASLDGKTAEIEADVLICADGIHSAARNQMFPGEGLPVYSGRVLWRGTSLAHPYLTGATMIMAGHQNQKFVCYPIGPAREDGRQLINWIAELTVPEMKNREDWNRAGQLSDFLPRFESWIFDWLDIPALIRDAKGVYEFPMVDRDPLDKWNDGRVTLLGDAAHPMYPIGSNGASQAILDADALARAVRTEGEAGAALAMYERERLPATAAIVRANRQNGPEQCMQLAHERAPNGFEHLHDVFAPEELQEIADRYKQLTGLAKVKVQAGS